MQTKTLLAALIGLSILFIGFVWWVYAMSAGTLPLSVPLLGSVLPLALGAGIWWWQTRATRRAAGKLEDALAADAARAQRSSQRERSAEIDRLRGEFETAVRALKASKLASGSRRAGDALYRLPWYAIIGPPASGKTTVLRNSGLKFPYLPGTGDRLKGVGGTRNCDWWLTNHAILLDTAGRWSIQEEERDEWLAFLELLKKHRGEHPLNGIIAAISIAGDDATSIQAADPDELREIALRMRERLDEITGRLGVALPVYLLFTKCDLIHGFVEMFGTMSGEQRRQVWGFTAPVLQGARRDPGTYFSGQFDLLREELERRALTRMSDEIDPRVMPRIYEFPAQFATLRDKLTLFVEELFDASAYRETPLLRGAYFTSGTQEGTPSDLLFEDLADALRLRPAELESREEKKSYFLHDMLMRVVFEDRALATTSEPELLRRLWRKRAATAGTFVAATALALLSTHACQRNLGAITRTRTVLAQAEQVRPQALSAPAHVAELSALEHDLTEREHTEPGLADLGLYQGDRIAPAQVRHYQQALTEWVLTPLMRANQAELLTRTQQLQVSAGAEQPSEQDDVARSELRDALGLHILLSSPRETCTPKPIARRDFILARLSTLWERAEHGDDQDERKRLLARYLALSSRGVTGAVFPRDARAVEQARRVLGEDDPVTRLLQRVIAHYAKDARNLTQLAGPGSVVSARGTIAGAFLRESWSKIDHEIAPSDFRETDADWVFGCDQPQNDEARAQLQNAAFRQKYLERYHKSWRSFVSGLGSRKPSNLADAESMLNELVMRPGLLGGLMQSVRANTELPAAVSGVAAAADKASAALAALPKVPLADGLKRKFDNPSVQALAKNAEAAPSASPADSARAELARAFADFTSFDRDPNGGANTPLEQYRQKLDPVLAALRAYRDDEGKLEELITAAQTALDGTERLLRAHGGSWNTQLRGLLLPVLSSVVELTQRGRGDHLARAFCDNVYIPFQQDLAGRFPFKPDSSEPASLAAFARFFQPGTGSLWAFQSTQLAGHVAGSNGNFRFTGGQARNLLRDDLLQFLQHAAAITRAFFPEGTGGPRVPFRIRVRGAPGYSQTSFRAGGRTVRYESGQEVWTALEWPGDQPTRGVALSVTPYQGAGPQPLALENPWGLFMILQPRYGAQVLERSAKRFTVGWRPKGDQHFVKIDFGSDDAHGPLPHIPFGANGLFPFSVPSHITQSGAACGGSAL